MKTTARILELVLVFVSISYGVFVTKKLIVAERKASYLEGRWSVYQEMAEQSPNPKDLKKW